MSSLSNLPYGAILDYWWERLRGLRGRKRFILTKIVEIYAFTKNNKFKKSITISEPVETPAVLKNSIPSKPKTTVIVPVYIKSSQDSDQLIRLINSLERQSTRPDDVFVIDDRSPLRVEIPGVNIIRKSSNEGPAVSRNLGMDEALNINADILAFTDHDCVCNGSWLENIVKTFLKNPYAHIVSGNTKSLNNNWLGRYHEMNGTLNGRAFKNSSYLLYGTTCNLAVSKLAARSLKFNERYRFAAGEDIDFCFRANQFSFKIIYSKEAVVYHDYGYSERFLRDIRKFYQQFSKYSKGESILLKEIPEYYNYFELSEEIQAL